MELSHTAYYEFNKLSKNYLKEIIRGKIGKIDLVSSNPEDISNTVSFRHEIGLDSKDIQHLKIQKFHLAALPPSFPCWYIDRHQTVHPNMGQLVVRL